MTSDHDALLRAICENPREDTPRLVYADWLEENGQPERAAFIRTDIAMSLRDEWDAERVQWEAGLTPEVLPRKPWFAAAYPNPDPKASYSWHGPILIRRGFRWVAKIWHRTPPMFSTEAPDLFARHPIESLLFFDHHPDFARLITEPWFPRLTGLGWTDGRCAGRILRPLLNLAPPGLTELDLSSRAVNPDGMRALGKSPLFMNLTRLELSGVGPRVIGAMLDALAAVRDSCRLRTLTIDFDSLRQFATALAASLPASLRVLRLPGAWLSSAGIREFVGALATSGLRRLDLPMNGIGNDGATAIFTSPHLAGLKVLDLSYCQVGDDALRALLDNSPLADGLKLLNLTSPLASGLSLLNLTGSPASGDMKQAVKERMGDRVRI